MSCGGGGKHDRRCAAEVLIEAEKCRPRAGRSVPARRSGSRSGRGREGVWKGPFVGVSTRSSRSPRGGCRGAKSDSGRGRFSARREAAAEPTKFVCRDALSPLGEAASNHSLSDAAESAGAAITFSGVRVLVAPSAVPLGHALWSSGGRKVRVVWTRTFVSDNDRCPFPETAFGFAGAIAVFTTPRWILKGCRGFRAARALLLLF